MSDTRISPTRSLSRSPSAYEVLRQIEVHPSKFTAPLLAGLVPHKVAIIALIIISVLWVRPAFAQGSDEFVGPFPSWGNVKTQYGAVGNGVADDTVKLQNALNDLGQSGKPSVMYLPAGTYKITSTLTLASRIHVSIIGEDPATTSIIWAGPSGGTMLYINGVAYSRFDRLTWDGRSSASIAVDQSKADASSSYFDTSNEYADDTFIDVGFGIHGGFLGFGFAETSVLRSHFIRNSQAGIALGNFNALDLFVWNSTFVNCNVGVTNTPGAGNFNIYTSIFTNSAVADISIQNTGGFNFRNNFSSGSNTFIVAGGTGNPANITIQGNTILDPISKTAISIGNEGPVFLIDNVIRSLSTVTTGPVVSVANWNPSDLFSIGNTFTVSNPTNVNGRIHIVDDQVVSRSSINPTLPSLPGTLPNYHRQVFEVPAGSTTATFQQIIANASVQNGSHPVVHLPSSQLFVDTTIVIPSNTDLQLVGDGGASMIAWTGSGTGPVFRLAGPSKAILRDFYIKGGGKADGILVENADQPGSRVFMEQPYLNVNQANLLVDRLDYTNVQLQDFYHDGSGLNQTSIKVVGGSSAAAGTWLGGKTNIFSGASSDNRLTYEALQGAHLNVRDSWYETGSFPQFIRLTGNSTFSFSGARIALPSSSTSPAIDIRDFTGKASFITSNIDGNVVMSGNGAQSRVLGIGLVGPSQTYFANSASPAGQAALFGSTTWNSTLSGSGASQIPEQGVYDVVFIRDMLTQVRSEQPGNLSTLPGGVTDVRMYRVAVEQGLTGIHLVGAPPDTTAPTVTITAPTTGVTVSGSGVTISATAADNVGVVGVQFQLDGGSLGVEDTSSPYFINWNTTTASNGSHLLTAVVRDAAGNQTISPAIAVTVSNSAAAVPAGLLWHNSVTGQTSLSSMNGTGASSTAPLLTDPDWKVIGTPDFDGDGKDDLLWYNETTGQTAAWIMNGTSASSWAVLLTSSQWKVSKIADLNGDGKDDLVWYNESTGQTAAWIMNGTNVSSWSLLLTSPEWKVIEAADFNGDGKDDLLWYKETTGETAVWLMNGTSASSWSSLITAPEWKVIKTADLNGDGKADLLWYNESSGETAVWLMNGTSASSWALLLTAPQWKVIEAADFNGDGKDDLIWYNETTGQTAAWIMNGASASSWSVLLTDLNWKVVGAADFNGDGKADLLWQNDVSGQTTVWMMNGTSMLNSAPLSTDLNLKAIMVVSGKK